MLKNTINSNDSCCLHFLPLTVTSPCCKRAHIHVVYSHATIVCVTECILRYLQVIGSDFCFQVSPPYLGAVVTTPAPVTMHAGDMAFQHQRNIHPLSSPPNNQGRPKNFEVCRAGWKGPLKILGWPSKKKGKKGGWGVVCKTRISCGCSLSIPLKINREMAKNKNRFGAVCLNIASGNRSCSTFQYDRSNPVHIFPLQLDSGHKHDTHTPLRHRRVWRS